MLHEACNTRFAVRERKANMGARGFTLTELVVIIILIGILAAVVVPRLQTRGAYDERVLADELISTARHAQQIAMMRGSGFTVRLTLDDGNARYGIELRQGNGAWQWLNHTDGTAFPIAYPAGVSTAPALVQVSYNALGHTLANTARTVSINGSPALCIEATGYAHAGSC